MGVRILHDTRELHDQAVLFCSTTDWAFGPVFIGSEDYRHDAAERAEAFLRWVDSEHCNYRKYDKTQVGNRCDVRCLTESGLQAAYSDWLAQEADQWTREEAAEAELLRDDR